MSRPYLGVVLLGALALYFVLALQLYDARSQVADLRGENDQLAERLRDNAQDYRQLRARVEAVEARQPVVDENFKALFDWASNATSAINRTAGGVQNLRTCTGLQSAVMLELAGSGRC